MDIKFQASPNHNSRMGKKVTHIIIHAMAGSYQGSIATFLKSFGGNRVSAHYLISKKGEITQMVQDQDSAWHVGNANSFTIGIEHEDAFFARLGNGKVQLSKTCLNDPLWMTPVMLQNSAKLAASLIIKHGIPQDKIKERVIGHNSLLMRQFGNSHADPGPFFSWDKYYSLIEEELKNATQSKEPPQDHS